MPGRRTSTIRARDCNPRGIRDIELFNLTENRCRASSFESGYRSRHVWTWRSNVSRRELLRSSNTRRTRGFSCKSPIPIWFSNHPLRIRNWTEYIMHVFFYLLASWYLRLDVQLLILLCNFWFCTLTITYEVHKLHRICQINLQANFQ